MDVISSGPIRAASVLWQRANSGWVLTVVCKATYVLLPGESPIADEQEYINEDDNHWNDDPARSLYSPSDLAPFKLRADVMLVGHAFAPRGEPARSIMARLLVGDVDKGIEIFGERAWAQDRTLREAARFIRMPLRYERAAGGPDTANPVGVRSDGRDIYGNTPIPNLQPVGLHLASPENVFEPINFGPIAPGWRARREKLGRHAATWSDTAWSTRPLPDDIDPGFFNAAPRDQQLAELRDNERIVLENLHPTHARLVTNLSGVHPQAFVAKPSALPHELTLKADTLWIDTDRSLCTLTWRGQIKLISPAQPGRVLVATAAPGQRLSWADVQRIHKQTEPSVDEPPDLTFDALPDPDEEPDDTALLAQLPFETGLPFVPSAPVGGPSTPPPVPPPAPPLTPPSAPPGSPAEAQSRDTSPGMRMGDASPPWLARSGVTAPPGGNRPAPPAPSMSPTGASPPSISAQPVASPAITSPIAQPAMSAPPPPPPPIPQSPVVAPPPPIPQPPVVAPPPPIPQPLVVAPPPLAYPSQPSAPIAPAILDSPWAGPALAGSGSSGGVPGGAVAASNAAASATAWSSANPAPLTAETSSATTTARPGTRIATREIVDLLWYEPTFVDRIREEPKWKELLASLKRKPDAFEEDPFEDAPKVKPPEKEKASEERRDVFGVLTRASITDLEGVNEAIADGVAEDGTFNRPILVLSGDLTFPFDELETLKATVTAVTPLIAGDKKLKETVDTVNELLKTPWLQSSSGVAEGLTTRVKDAFGQGNRMLPPSYLDTHTERMLLEQRHYQKRTVFGELWIRSLLLPVGSSQSIPAYLPDSLSKKLPMFQTMKVRLIAEAHLQQDQYETHPSSLRVIALGRVVVMPSRAGRAGGQ